MSCYIQFSSVLLQVGVLKGIQCDHVCDHLSGQYSSNAGDPHHNITGGGVSLLPSPGTYVHVCRYVHEIFRESERQAAQDNSVSFFFNEK